MNLYRYLLAEDVFVAYSRVDGYRYAEALASEFSRLGYSCAIDQWTSLPGEQVPRELFRALRRSCILVVVGSAGAAQSSEVEGEVREFQPLRRPIVPISFAGSLERAGWFSLLQGSSIERESDTALENYKPSENVLRRVKTAATQRTRAQRQLLVSTTVLLLTAIVVGLGGWKLRLLGAATASAEKRFETAESRERASIARLNQANLDRQRAETTRDRATEGFRVAEAKAKQAEGRRERAELETESTELAVAAQTSNSIEESFRLALQGIRVSATAAAKRSLAQAFTTVPRLQARILCPSSEYPRSVDFSRPGQLSLNCSPTTTTVSAATFATLGVTASKAPRTAGKIEHEENRRSSHSRALESHEPSERDPLVRAAELRCDNLCAPVTAVDSSGERSACSRPDNIVIVWRTFDEFTVPEELKGHGNNVTLISFGPSDPSSPSRLVVTGGALSNGRSGFLIWDLAQPSPLARQFAAFPLARSFDLHLLITSDGGRVLCSGCSDQVEVIPFDGSTRVRISALDSFRVGDVTRTSKTAFLADHNAIFRLSLGTGPRKHTVERIASAKEVSQIVARSDEGVTALGSETVWSWTSGAGVRVRSLKSYLPRGADYLVCSALAQGGSALAVEYKLGSRNQVALIGLTENLQPASLSTIDLPEKVGDCGGWAFSRDGKTGLRWTFSYLGETYLLRGLPDGGSPPEPIANPLSEMNGLRTLFTSVSASSEGRLAVATLGSERPGFVVIDLVRLVTLGILRSPSPLSAFAVSPDGQIAVTAQDGALYTWPLDYRAWEHRAQELLSR